VMRALDGGSVDSSGLTSATGGSLGTTSLRCLSFGASIP
jgi:hypothetical protein